jgi:hypothetical protein
MMNLNARPGEDCARHRACGVEIRPGHNLKLRGGPARMTYSPGC